MKIPFTASARTAMLIGTENFSNPEGAIIELVKNTYDADSPCCYILFDGNDGQITEIYIIDYGCGMDISTIQDCWMQIGTDDKQRNVETGNGRIKSGAKGIGRFALNRLGSMATMLTRKYGQDAFIWNVNWNDFDAPGKKINEIMAELDVVNITKIQACISDLERKFKITLPEYSTGTILKISQLSDDWTEEKIFHLFDSLQDLVPPFNIPAFKQYLYVAGYSDLGKIETKSYEDFDYKVSAHYENQILNLKVVRNELDVKTLATEYRDVFMLEDMQHEPYTLNDFERGFFVKHLALLDLNVDNKRLIEENLNKIGNFQFDFYFVKNSKSDIKSENSDAKYPYRLFSPTHRRPWMKRNVGVKIYRDGFRVRPYGENGDDWLRLSDRYAKNPVGAGHRKGGYHIRQNQIVGAVEISRIDNLYLQDKSGREGLQENDVFEIFKEILLGIINQMEVDRNVIMYSLARLYDIKHPKEKSKDDADKAQRDGYVTIEAFNSLSNGYTVLKEELEEKDSELRLLRNLASTGLVITSFSHELKNFKNIAEQRAGMLVKMLDCITSEKEIIEKGLNQYENPYEFAKDLKRKDTQIRSWLEFSINSISNNKRIKNWVNLQEYFSTFYATWKSISEELHIEFEILGMVPEMKIKAYAIDLDTIFNNLISNSIYAIKERKSIDNRRIRVFGKLENDVITIRFSDTGKGLDEQYKDNPSCIFDAFESSKIDKNGVKIGTGLGLYIVKSTLDEFKDGEVRVVPVSEGFCVEIKIKNNV